MSAQDFPRTQTRTVPRPSEPGQEIACRNLYQRSCTRCGDQLQIGEQVWYTKGEGARHFGICRKLELARWKAEAESSP